MGKQYSTRTDAPYLTIVATSRNDDHGGNLLHRMQLFLNGLLAQCERYRLSAELVLVEWNPPSDKPRLIEVLRWPATRCSIRIVEVPHLTHNRFKYSESLPLFQMIAKNVGIRRAQGKFVLATNVDILFSNEVMRFLASGSLRKGCIYRVDRHDVPQSVPLDAAIDKRLEFCEENAFRVCHREGTLDIRTGKYYSDPFFIRARLHRRQIAFPARFLPSGMKRKLRALAKHFQLHMGVVPLHTNACGDFTLMAKEHWFSLRGYPELEMFSLHIDSLLCCMAYYAGITEIVLPYPVYHIEHTSGLTPEVERDKTLDRCLSESGIPRLSNAQLSVWAMRMHRQLGPIVFNGENWGLADQDLSEITTCPGAKIR